MAAWSARCCGVAKCHSTYHKGLRDHVAVFNEKTTSSKRQRDEPKTSTDIVPMNLLDQAAGVVWRRHSKDGHGRGVIVVVERMRGHFHTVTEAATFDDIITGKRSLCQCRRCGANRSYYS